MFPPGCFAPGLFATGFFPLAVSATIVPVGASGPYFGFRAFPLGMFPLGIFPEAASAPVIVPGLYFFVKITQTTQSGFHSTVAAPCNDMSSGVA